MRNSFINALEQEAERDSDIIFLTADLGFQMIESFAKRFPKQFLNVGIAEQNMVGMAAGMALMGKKSICYTIATFMTMRTYEQVRNDICLHEANVKIVGVGGGFGYSMYGPTHHPLEDVAIMRTLPGMTVICPIDPNQTAAAVRAMLKHNGPVYLRLGKKGEPAIHTKEPRFQIGQGAVLREGGDIAIISTGPITFEALEAAEILHAQGIQLCVVAMPTVKPLDILLLDEIGRKIPYILTLEEGTIMGGFGSAIASYYLERGINLKGFYRLGTADRFVKRIGTADYLRAQFGLDGAGIAETARDMVSSRR